MAVQRTPEELRVRRLLREALWEIGDLSWALHPAQLEDEVFRERCFAAGIRRVVELCGRRYGKTRGLVVDAFQQAIRFPGSRLPYAAKTWESAKSYVIPEARYLIENGCPKKLKPDIVDGEIRFPNGSVIPISGSATEVTADNLRGPAARRVYVDEAAFNPTLKYAIDDVLQPQLLTTGGSMIVASSAPTTPAHHFASLVRRAKKRAALVQRTTLDAPHITKADADALAEEMGGWESTSARRELLCEIVVDETRAIVPEWNRWASFCTTEVPAREYRWWWIAADLGYRDGTAILYGWVDWYGLPLPDGSLSGPVLVIEHEDVLRRPTSEDVYVRAATTEREQRIPKERVRARTADADAIVVADLRKLQKIRGAVLERETEQFWRRPRKDALEGAVNHLRLLIKRGQFRVHPRCTQLIEDLEGGVWDEKREQFERQEERDESGAVEVWHFDALAALVDMVRTADLTVSPEPDLWVPGPARKPHPGDNSRGTLPSRPGGRVHLGRNRR